MIEQHLVALLVIIPLIGAPACLLLPGNRLPWLWAGLISAVLLTLAVRVLQRALDADSLDYAMGGWLPPWGIAYRIDLLNALMILLVTALALLVLAFAGASAAGEIRATRIPGFYAAFLLLLAGLLGIAVTADVFNLFVFLEISSLASYALISLGRERRALLAAYQYLVLGTIGATFILIGIGLLYAMTGTLNMEDLAQRLTQVAERRTVHTGLAFIVIGFAIKLALFPLHLWLPNAYAYAPSVVSIFLAATSTKIALYALLRFIYSVFGADYVFGHTPLGWLLIGLAAAAMLSGSWVALFQHNVKRLLAYSSVAQIGYMVLGISLASTTGVIAATLHVFNHALMKGVLFLALGAVVYRIGGVSLRDFAGLGRRMPWTMASIVLGGLSLIGVPPTAGFITKWYLLQGTLEQGLWPVAVLVLIGSLLALLYVWKLVEAAYFESAPEGAAAVTEAPWSMLLPIWLLVGANIYFGIHTEVTVGLATQAAYELMGAGQ